MKKKSNLKKIIIVLFILIVCSVLLFANRFIGGKRGAIEVTTGKVEKGTVEQIVQATGIIEPALKIKVRSEVDGNLREKRVKDGQQVKQGDVLLEVDQEKLKKEVLNSEIKMRRLQNNLKNLVENTGPFDEAQAKNNLEKSRISLEFAEKNLASTKRIFEQEVVTRRQLEEAERSLENAKLDYQVSKQQLDNQKEKFDKDVTELKGEIQIAEVELKEARDKFDKAMIKAPIAGSIVEDIIKEKRYVSFGEEVFAIGDLSKFIAKVKVDELDIGKVKVDQPVNISSDAFKDNKLTGHVTEIAAQATRQTFAEIEVTVTIDSTYGQPVRPNLSVDVDIQTQKRDNVLKVPLEAVVKQDNKNYVFALNSNRVKKKEVTIGENSPKFLEIKSGLKENETIVLQGATRLKDGDRVKIKKPPKSKK